MTDNERTTKSTKKSNQDHSSTPSAPEKNWKELVPDEKVARWLGTTGYAVEARTAKAISDRNYFEVTAPSHYLDMDHKTVKELDVFATKNFDAISMSKDSEIQKLRQFYFSEEKMNEALGAQLRISLNIECKYAKESWVLFSSAPEHSTGSLMSKNCLASGRGGDNSAQALIDSIPKHEEDEFPLLFNRGVLGSSLRQVKDGSDGKPSNTDDCYKAIQSALVSSYYEISKRDEPKGRPDKAHLIAIPIIVVAGAPLFNAYTDENFEVLAAPIPFGRVLYKLPNKMESDFFIDVVHIDSLNEYLDRCTTTCDSLSRHFGQLVKSELHKEAVRRQRQERGSRNRSSIWT